MSTSIPSETTEYRIWSGMKKRCLNPASKFYRNYGGRGIKVCDRWLSFGPFLEDMGKRPGLEYSLDRINNDGNYEPGNCKWATRKQQGRNRRCNRRVTHRGETLIVSEWAEKTGIPYKTLSARINSGWDAMRALTTPVRDWKSLTPEQRQSTVLRQLTGLVSHSDRYLRILLAAIHGDAGETTHFHGLDNSVRLALNKILKLKHTRSQEL